jgi:chromosome segregation ATPase
LTNDQDAVNRRLALLEEDVQGEKLVTRHILRKVTELEGEARKTNERLSALEDRLVTLRADLPGIIAAVVGPLLREALAKR